MPVHDWTRVDAGLFHNFHQGWTIALRNALNSGGLPSDYFALVDQSIHGPIPDVLTLQLSHATGVPNTGTAALAVAAQPPRGRAVKRSEAAAYAKKANRITVRHRHGDIVAAIEIVPPGNTASATELRAFVQKSANLIRQGVHILVVDLFSPGPRDPRGISNAIWDEFDDNEVEVPSGKPITLASFEAGPSEVAYIEYVAVGDLLPAMPLFLKPDFYVPAPLEATYVATWQVFPGPLKGLLE
jgi:hypothetical protein